MGFVRRLRFYNLRVGWAGGKPDPETARFIYLYSSFLPSFATVVIALYTTAKQPVPYLPGPEYDEIFTSVLIASLFIVILWYHSIYVSYCGVTERLHPTRWGGLGWFVIGPSLVYAPSLLIVLFMLLFGDATE